MKNRRSDEATERRTVGHGLMVVLSVIVALLAVELEAGDGGGEPGVGALIEGRFIVRVRTDATLEEFVAAFETDHEGLTLTERDAIPSRRTYLLGAEAPAGTNFDLLAEQIEIDYLAWLVWGEGLYENSAPEGHTGSVFVDNVAEDEVFPEQYARTTLGLDDAHEVSTGAGVLVAVIDTGVDVDHPLLAPHVTAGGWNFLGNNADVSDVGDGVDTDSDGLTDEMVGHGTFVAGLVLLTAPDAWILPVRVLNGDGRGDAWALTRGVQHAIERGADVINLSLGSTYNSNAVNDAIGEAMSLGIVTVSAAGNLDRSEPEEYPAMRTTGFGVAAVDHQDLKADFSNFNDKIFISAPGTSVVQNGVPEPTLSIISSIPGGGYAVWGGTSMAAPFVTGTAALIRAQHPEWPCPPAPPPKGNEPAPNCAYLGIEAALTLGAVDIYGINPVYAEDESLGVGRLDAGAAVAQGPVAPGPGDLNHDGTVDVDDLVLVITSWGPCVVPIGCDADANRDGVVNVDDLVLVILNWV